MDEFVKKILNRVSNANNRLSIVRNPDGFLLRADTQQYVEKEGGLLLLEVSSIIQLRVRYELEDKDSDKHVCYVCKFSDEIQPDMKKCIFDAGTFSLSDILTSCNKYEIDKAKLCFNRASYIYNQKFAYDLNKEETRKIISESENLYNVDINLLRENLKMIPLKWEKRETIEAISRNMLKAIEAGKYEELEDVINILNDDFQTFINDNYFNFINSSHLKKPKIVNKILPYISYKHDKTDKVALIVIDGMAYWQYMILEKHLNLMGIKTKNDITFAWIPTITKLSRQAIFRGEAPLNDYNQCPESETKLWKEFWTSPKKPIYKRFSEQDIEYSHNGIKTKDITKIRQAFVDVQLDEKMHSSSGNKDLFSLTQNWAELTAEDIAEIHRQGYTIYITTDHGNISASEWRNLNSQEKTYLYEKESRGRRHLIYSKKEYLDNFLADNADISNELLVHDTWAVWRNNKCFYNEGCITHGGSHFLEVVIPFITIEKEKND